MEFWLVKNKNNKIQLPVNPKEFTLMNNNDLKYVNVNNLGEVVMLGNSNLSSITISCFFPATEYPFVTVTDLKKPYAYVKKIIAYSKKPLTLIITQTNINHQVVIDSFEYGEKDGTGDVYYTLTFRQYRELKIKKTKTTKKNKVKNNTRGGSTKVVTTYKVKKGDTIKKIAKKVYGDKSKYKTLLKKNNLKLNDVLKPGKVLKC